MQWVNKLNLKDVSLRKCSRIVRTSGSCNLTLAAATISDSGQFNLRISAFFAPRQSESTKLIHCNALGTFSFFVLAIGKWGHFRKGIKKNAKSSKVFPPSDKGSFFVESSPSERLNPILDVTKVQRLGFQTDRKPRLGNPINWGLFASTSFWLLSEAGAISLSHSFK